MISSRTLFVTILTLLTVACGAKMETKGRPTSPASPQPNSLYSGISTGAAQYQGSMLNADVALNGMGQWVSISNQRFFAPNSNLVGQGWEPYQNGSWMYDRDRGWTWVSADRFGWLTDHYGIWRHHRVHGWLWLPFHDMRYVPHAATWWDDGDNSQVIGWYPYFSDYQRGYTLGSIDGFDDGYWRGNLAIPEHVSGSATFHLGLSLIRRQDAGENNLRRFIISDRNFVWSTAQRSQRAGRFNRDGRHPGGEKDRAYGFLQYHARKKLKVGQTKTIRSQGGARFMQPKAEADSVDRKDQKERKEQNTQKES